MTASTATLSAPLSLDRPADHYDVQHADGLKDVAAYHEFGGTALRAVLSRRFGPVTQNQVDGFSLHTGKDKRTVFRYLSGELSIPRWAVFMAISLGRMSDAEIADVWNEARKTARKHAVVFDIETRT